MRPMEPLCVRRLQWRSGAANLYAALVLGLTTSCALDWDHLDPSKGEASATGGVGTGGVGTGGVGTGGASATGGADATGGASSGAGGGNGTGGSGSAAPTCSGSVLVNSGFETKKNGKNYPASWTFAEQGGSGATWLTDTDFVSAGSSSVKVETREVTVTGNQEYSATLSAQPADLDGHTKLTATMAVYVKELTQGSVSVVAHFETGSGPIDVDVASVGKGAEYVAVGDEADVPTGATSVALVIRIPAGALVYLDDACVALSD